METKVRCKYFIRNMQYEWGMDNLQREVGTKGNGGMVYDVSGMFVPFKSSN